MEMFCKSVSTDDYIRTATTLEREMKSQVAFINMANADVNAALGVLAPCSNGQLFRHFPNTIYRHPDGPREKDNIVFEYI
jgi:hypothetical protein